MLKTNEKTIVEFLLQCQPGPQRSRGNWRMDHDNRYGRAYRKGAVTIGAVVHSDCLSAGHGPGVTTLMTCKTSLIRPVIDPRANIADLLKIGTTAKTK